MIRQIVALAVCAFLALLASAETAAKPEAPKMVEPKKLDPSIEIKLLRAQSAAQQAAAETAAWVAEYQKRMLLEAQFQANQMRQRQTTEAYGAALEEARKASGAPKECDRTTDGRWVRYEQGKESACLIPEADAAIKTEGAENVKIDGEAAKK